MSETDDEAERFRTMAIIVNAMIEPDPAAPPMPPAHALA
jgi:hypothetical protein